VDVEAVADELYGLPPSEFTHARDTRIADARKAGDRATADALKKLRRPSAGASMANHLVRERSGEIERFLALASQLRDAQAKLDGDSLRRLSKEGRDAVAALVRDASTLARRDGLAVSAAAFEDLEATLDAALADPVAGETLRAGRLTTALRYSGLGLSSPTTPSPARGSQDRGDRPVLAAAERELARASQELERVLAQLKDAETAVRAAQTTLAEREDVAERARRRAREAQDAARSAEKRVRALRRKRA
jgi:exonuclease VII small subunit